MARASQPLFYSLAVASLLLLCGAPQCMVQALTTWGYHEPDEELLPSKWGNLYPECAGRSQSPIDIRSSAAQVVGTEFLRHYTPARLTFPLPLAYNGHTIQLDVSNRSTFLATSVAPDLFQQAQLHFHTPSEHTIDGVSSDLEMHVVHFAIDKERFGSRPAALVMGILYNVGAADPWLEQLTSQTQFTSLATINSTTIDMGPQIDFPTQYYVYPGSLTTPPCTETVTWLVASQVRTASAAQIQRVSSLFVKGGVGNNRPIQPLNGRRLRKVPFAGSEIAEANVAAGAAPSSSPSSGSSGSCGGLTYLNFAHMIDSS